MTIRVQFPKSFIGAINIVASKDWGPVRASQLEFKVVQIRQRIVTSCDIFMTCRSNFEPVGRYDESDKMVAYITDKRAGGKFIAVYIEQDVINKRFGIVLNSGCFGNSLEKTFFNY